MDALSKIYKIKIGNKALSITLDNSYLAENIYIPDSYSVSTGEMHYHALYEMFLVGEDGITIFGEDYKKSFKNCILIVPPFFKHFTIRNTDHRITFSYKASKEVKAKPFALKLNDNINFYAEKIKDNLLKNGTLNEEKTECFLKLIFCEIANENAINYDAKYTPKNESYLEKIEKVLLDFASNITLDNVAEELNLSKKQAARIIRKNYNATFAEMLRERRLSAAASLLANTDMTISEIVEQVNFPTECYFYNKFKEAYNMTPISYRKTKRCQN